MLAYRDSRLTYSALGIFFLIVLGYGFYEARGVLFGPSISITTEISEVHEPLILIEGHADRIASLSMNGAIISVTETGDFEEPYILAPGYNRVVLDAHDKYGRKKSATVEIVYTPPLVETILNPVATTTQNASTTEVAY